MAQQAKRNKKTRKMSVRMTTEGADHIIRKAAKADVTPAHMHRRMLAFAAMNMPDNWVPPTGT